MARFALHCACSCRKRLQEHRQGGLTILLKVKDAGDEPVVVQVLLAGAGYAVQAGVLPRVSARPAIEAQ